MAIAALSLSAAGLVSLAIQEGYTDRAIIPVLGDKPTLGFGMTERPDGSPVQMGDRTNPVEALQRTLAWVQRGEAQFKRCVTAPLHQAEYDLYLDHMYNIGVGAFCSSTMVKRLNAGDYVGACNQFPQWKRAGKTDCSVPGNRICPGLWTRRLEAQQKCLALQ
jgi:lysozyme